MTLLLLGFELCISSILIVLSSKLINLLSFFFRLIRDKLEVLLTLFQGLLLFPDLAHLFFFHFFNVLISSLFLHLYLTLINFKLFDHIIILGFFHGKFVIIRVVSLNCFFKLILLLLKQGLHLAIHVGLSFIIFHHILLLLLLIVIALVLVEHLFN